jgi:hypothetical protein
MAGYKEGYSQQEQQRRALQRTFLDLRRRLPSSSLYVLHCALQTILGRCKVVGQSRASEGGRLSAVSSVRLRSFVSLSCFPPTLSFTHPPTFPTPLLPSQPFSRPPDSLEPHGLVLLSFEPGSSKRQATQSRYRFLSPRLPSLLLFTRSLLSQRHDMTALPTSLLLPGLAAVALLALAVLFEPKLGLLARLRPTAVEPKQDTGRKTTTKSDAHLPLPDPDPLLEFDLETAKTRDHSPFFSSFLPSLSS